jgi:hypothetical protein
MIESMKAIFKVFLSAAFLAGSLPGYSLACERPCAMSQAQMLRCAQACAASAAPADAVKASLSRAACMRLLSKAGLDAVLVASQAPLRWQGFVQATLPQASSDAAVPCFTPIQRGPPLPSPVQASLREIPAQNAPPAAI